MRDIIITSTDSKYGDFLINHWLKSLRHNVDLSNIDVLVLDYGLSREQKMLLKEEDVAIRKCKRNGSVVIIRYRDAADFLSKHEYGQVLLVDSGDIIFQDDIKKMFEKNKSQFRALCEKYFPRDMNKSFSRFFTPGDIKKMQPVLKHRPMINSGVIIGPAKKIERLCEEVWNTIQDKTRFGPDQKVVNYVLYRDGFKMLDEGYNMVVATSKNGFYVKNGVFYFKNGIKIPIVHNAGNVSFLRPIENFGYGAGHNQVKKLVYHSIRCVGRVRSAIMGD